ncbi:uncharacterized protein [Solanum lycopersicum]|uniref:uncharacterized protein n=1 Tax=Solanum lycopersicum TaxID=4081 RepID=UPI00374A3D87
MLKQLYINIPLVEALEHMPGYAKFMKDLVTKKRSVIFKDDDRMKHCSAIATRSLVQKKEDPGAFTTSCTLGSLHFAKALCDLGESINLMTLSIYKKLGLGDPKPFAMGLLMADRTMKRPIGILHDVLVKVESFIFLANLVILDCEVDFEVPIILWKVEATFNICRSMRQSGELQSVSAISYKEKIKKNHDLQSEKRELMIGDLVLLYNSRSRWFLGKLKSKWTGPYLITQLLRHGAVELKTKEGEQFKVNGGRMKPYFRHVESVNEESKAYHLDKE